MKRTAMVVCSMFFITVMSFGSLSCNTIRGAGQDIERVWEEIEDAAD
jgi:predicted small secreted protein